MIVYSYWRHTTLLLVFRQNVTWEACVGDTDLMQARLAAVPTDKHAQVHHSGTNRQTAHDNG
jgi:hypothetical protein